MSDIGDDLKALQERQRKEFGPQNTLQQVLWDGQVEDFYFNETFSAIIMMMKQCVEDEEYKKQLYEINLEDYKNEDEE